MKLGGRLTTTLVVLCAAAVLPPAVAAGDPQGDGEDVTPPVTSFDSAPPSLGNSREALFAFHASEEATFTCSLDGTVAQDCSSPVTVTGLSDGPHSFVVQATDVARNLEKEPPRVRFTVDATPPAVSIVGGDRIVKTKKRKAVVSLGVSTEPDAKRELSIDGAGFTVISPEALRLVLRKGLHTIVVRATDALGNSAEARTTVTVRGAKKAKKKRKRKRKRKRKH